MNEDVGSCIEILERGEVELASGLTERELSRAELTIGARFPDDLRELLSHVLPVGNGWPDWRAPDSELIERRMAAPWAGLEFDIVHNGLWYPGWGEMPGEEAEAIEVARAFVADVPLLIPVYSHRYLSAEPTARGNPILSVHQSDIIYYGSNLPHYMAAEFSRAGRVVRGELRRVRFWFDFIDFVGGI